MCSILVQEHTLDHTAQQDSKSASFLGDLNGFEINFRTFFKYFLKLRQFSNCSGDFVASTSHHKTQTRTSDTGRTRRCRGDKLKRVPGDTEPQRNTKSHSNSPHWFLMNFAAILQLLSSSLKPPSNPVETRNSLSRAFKECSDLDGGPRRST